MKRALQELHAPKTPFELERIKFVPAQRPDVISVPEGIDVIVLSAEPQVRCDPSLRRQSLAPNCSGLLAHALRDTPALALLPMLCKP